MIVSQSGYQTEAVRPGAHSAGLCRLANAPDTAVIAGTVPRALLAELQAAV